VRTNPKTMDQKWTPGFSLVFLKEKKEFLSGTSIGYNDAPLEGGGIYFTSELVIQFNPGRGPFVSSLQDTEAIRLTFHNMPDNSKIHLGGLYCLINYAIPLSFSIPQQKVQGKEIRIGSIREVLQSLKP
jgi:hypothetical protein